MMKKFILSLLLSAATFAQANDIILSAKIEKSVAAKIERDMDVLDNFNFKQANPKILKVMGLSNLNATSASKWLGDRVKYIIEQSNLTYTQLLKNKVLFIEQEDASYPNAGLSPHSFNANKQGKNDSLLMTNTGSTLYFTGKKDSRLYGINIASNEFSKRPIQVIVDSPRAGIIQVGNGLFSPLYTPNTADENSLANSINRLGTFFHEARHSDGNGTSLGFFHSKCPAGHDMAGAFACDENLNGPYNVGALMILEMIKSCGDNCSEKEKEFLKITALDSANRIIYRTSKGAQATGWDATPESL